MPLGLLLRPSSFGPRCPMELFPCVCVPSALLISTPAPCGERPPKRSDLITSTHTLSTLGLIHRSLGSGLQQIFPEDTIQTTGLATVRWVTLPPPPNSYVEALTVPVTLSDRASRRSSGSSSDPRRNRCPSKQRKPRAHTPARRGHCGKVAVCEPGKGSRQTQNTADLDFGFSGLQKCGKYVSVV